MSGIILIKKGSHAYQNLESAKAAFQKKSYSLNSKQYHLGDYELIYWEDYFKSNIKIFESPQGNFICYCGFLIYKGKTGKNALSEIETDLVNGHNLGSLKIKGTFLLIAFFNGKMYFLRDLFGGYGCFLDESNTWISTNFLAALRLRGKVVFRKQELLENIFFNMEFGLNTIVEGITVPISTKVFCLSDNTQFKREIIIPELEFDLKKCIDYNLEALEAEFKDYFDLFGNEVTSALSGGFDSRLILVSLLNAGIVPDLYVYGAENDPDVQVAKNICSNENIKLSHINRNLLGRDDFNNIEEVIYQNLWDFDGSNNLFSPSNELQTRLERSKTGFLVLNGAGGEIYRDTWKWDFSKTSVNKLFMNSYDTGELEIFGVNTKELFANIADKILEQSKDFIDIGNSITRQDADKLFLIYRSNFYFQGNMINNYFGNATLPFLSENIAMASFAIPYKFKRTGKFEAELIKRLNHKIAQYPSEYGFNFFDGPNFTSIFQEWAYAKLPPYVKAKIKKSLSTSKKSVFRKSNKNNPYLEEKYFNSLIRGQNSTVKDVISNVHLIKNPNTLNRIYSVGLLEFLH